MLAPPRVDIDLQAFTHDPYPDLARMRARSPVCFVPQLGSVLFTLRDDIAACEKNIAVFSSDQPEGLMTRLMGQNMMRKDGAPHLAERKATFPAFSPRTVRDVWTARFKADAEALLADLTPRGQADLVKDFAMPLSGAALRAMTGLDQLTPAQIDWISQAMINGISNYAGDPAVEDECRRATAFVDAAILDRLPQVRHTPDQSLISAQAQAGLPVAAIQANVKLAISGGQNEPRDAIAGAVWALLRHPEQLDLVRTGNGEGKGEGSGTVTWQQVFDEYVRWISPIGMSPRRVAQDYTWGDIALARDDRVFFMFGSANRDDAHFDHADKFDVTRDASRHIAFGAGPHFCAGAAASRALIADIALPMVFDALPALRLSGPAEMHGWAFRGLSSLPVTWQAPAQTA